jgi:hypothetical protein
MTATAANPERRYTAAEVAARLGFRKTDTIFALRRSGRLPGKPHGSRGWRWAEADIAAYERGEQPVAAVALTDAQLDAVAARVLARLLAAVQQPSTADELAPRRRRA